MTCKIDGRACPEHDAIHGQEAEELRKGVELLIKDASPAHNLASHHRVVKIGDLQRLLDRISARDSFAYLEAKDARDARIEVCALCGHTRQWHDDEHPRHRFRTNKEVR